MWRQTRSTVEATVRQLADTAVTLAQRKIPRALPKVRLPSMLKSSVPAKRAAKKAAGTKRVVKTRATKAVKRAKRSVKSATKR
jgi:hypothetical protein